MDLYKTTLAEEAYIQIKKKIISGSFSMGQQLLENQLSKSINVSRVSVRSALSRLSSEGLVISIPYRGCFVKPLSEEDVREVYDLRISLENFAAETVYEAIDDSQLDVMSAYSLKHKEFMEQGNIEDAVKMDVKFHQVPILATGNSRLERIWNLLYDEGLRLSYLASHSDANNFMNFYSEHEQITDGYRKRNLDLIRESLSIHLKNAAKRAISKLI